MIFHTPTGTRNPLNLTKSLEITMDEEFIATYSAKLEENSSLAPNGECRIWKSNPKNGYGWINFKIAGKWTGQYCHRLVYMMKHPKEKLENQISHLCHNRMCNKYEHLSHEPSQINNNRQSCVNTGRCMGHQGYADCKLHLKLRY